MSFCGIQRLSPIAAAIPNRHGVGRRAASPRCASLLPTPANSANRPDTDADAANCMFMRNTHQSTTAHGDTSVHQHPAGAP